MTLINTYDLDYDETGLTLAAKYPSLTVGPITLLLQADDTYYTAVIKYNHASEWLSLSVVNQDNETVQGETYLASFPTNLIFVDDLASYALFYYPTQKRLKFYSIDDDDDWYNSASLDEETAYYCYYYEVFTKDTEDEDSTTETDESSDDGEAT